MSTLTTDLNDLSDIESSIQVLQRRKADFDGGAAAPATGTDTGEPGPVVDRRRALWETYANYGSTRLRFARRVAEAAPGILSKEEAYELLASLNDSPPTKVLGGLLSSLERGWATRSKGMWGPLITTLASGFHMESDLAAETLSILDELGA